jgi:general secretion pathway protein B
MSFILDALKKAESERSRTSGPVLVDVRIAPPRRRLPAWAWALGAVLLANLAVLTWLVSRKPAVVEASTIAATPALAAPANVPAPATSAAPAAVSPVAPAVTASAVPPAVAIELPPPSQPANAVVTPSAPSKPPVLNGPPSDVDRLPSYREIQAAGVTLPQLTMNLHVYDPTPAQRYVMLNGLQLTEGEFTPDGIKVEVITERGVVLEARGRRFLLPSGS